MSENKTYVNVSEGKRKREELTLPNLHYATVDPFPDTESWLDTLGPKTFCAWLQLHTLVDRDYDAMEKYGNINTVPRSLENLAKMLKMSKSTLYRVVLKPLWNYGLIDIVEWQGQVKIGQKAMNIIVYHYPENNKLNETKPLVKVRDYDTEYKSSGKIYGRLGGRPSRPSRESNNPDRFKTETVDEINVSYVNRAFFNRFKTKTVTVSKLKPINISNTSINKSNTRLNKSNAHINSSNTDLLKNRDEEEEEYIYKLCITNPVFDVIHNFLNRKSIPKEIIFDTIKACYEEGLELCTVDDIQKQYEFMMKKHSEGDRIYDFPKYFANGLKKIADQSVSHQQHQHQEKELTFRKKSVPFYNWLVHREN